MTHLLKPIATSLLLLFAALCNASGAASPNSPKSIPELQAAIESVLKESRTPGAAIAIVSRDQVEWIGGIGKADVAADQPVTADTLFRIGSVSKGIVALAALQLQEEGKLKLTDTVRQWVPDVAFVNPWEATHPLRLVHLMEQTSGFDDMHLREYALNDPTPMALKDALAYGAASRVCRWPPGTRMSYCNSCPAVLAAVIEKVSGERFEDYVQEKILDPLHMDSASYFYTPVVARHLAKLYHPDGITPYPYYHVAFRPTAGLNASAKDMANYVRFYLQRGRLNGTRLLRAASIDRIETSDTLPSVKLGKMANYGLFNYPTLEGPFVFHGHSGGILGGVAQIGYLPDFGRGYAVMINSGNFMAMFKIGRLMRRYLTHDLKAPDLPPLAVVPTSIQQHYQGYYQGISPDVQWFYGFERLNVKKLTFTATGLSISTYRWWPKQWVPMSERLFRDGKGALAQVALLPDSEGKILIQSHWGTFKKISALRVWAQLVGIGVLSALVLSSLLLAPVWGLRTCLNWKAVPARSFRGQEGEQGRTGRSEFVRLTLGKLLGKASGPLSVRVWPLIGAVLLVAFNVLLFSAFRGILTSTYIDDIDVGVPTLLTVSIMLASIAFPLAAARGLYVAWRERNSPMNRLAYWHSVLVGAALIAVSIYYGYWGLIGLRLWA